MDAQNIPSFQSFLKQVPPVSDAQRLQPPVPTVKRRASSTSAARSRTPPSFQSRRSSSVYSQWGKDDVSWHSSDFADEPPVPPLPMLQPLVYSASTPHLAGKQPTPPLLQPRTYSPLLATPSPSVSQPATPLPQINDAQSDYICIQPKPRPGASRALNVIPLEKAILEIHAPGAVHLLPEEHRAQKRSRSHEAMKTTARGMVSSGSPPDLPESLVLIDSQGRPRSIMRSRGDLTTQKGAKAARFRACENPLNAATQYSRPLHERTAAADWAVSKTPNLSTSESHHFEVPRGRTMQRVPRNAREEKPRPVDTAGQAKPDAQAMAKEYHALLPQQYGALSSPPLVHTAGSDDSLRLRMKMMPSPLSPSTTATIGQKNVIRFGDATSSSPYTLSIHSRSPVSPAISEPIEYFPGPFSPPTERTHKRTSTSGSIPISPPTATNFDFLSQPVEAASGTGPRNTQSEVSKNSKRASAYYPHVASRKTKAKTKVRSRAGNGKTSSSNQSQDSRMAKFLLPLNIRPASDTLEEVRRRSSAGSDKSRQPLMQRFAKGAAKYADLFTQPELPERLDYEAITAATISPGSPHLTPISPSTTPKDVHLGWSDRAKTIFDKSVSPTFPSTKPVLYTHITTPARPLDESRTGLKDAEAPRRKSSIFGNFLDSWKESKAEKRRQDLKKTIKVFPNTDGSVGGGLRRSSSFGWM